MTGVRAGVKDRRISGAKDRRKNRIGERRNKRAEVALMVVMVVGIIGRGLVLSVMYRQVPSNDWCEGRSEGPEDQRGKGPKEKQNRGMKK